MYISGPLIKEMQMFTIFMTELCIEFLLLLTWFQTEKSAAQICVILTGKSLSEALIFAEHGENMLRT